MWLYTNQGHLSVVEDKNDSNKVIVRARNQDALSAFAQYIIEYTPKGDYKYRVNIEKTEFIEWFTHYTLNMGYGNFKDNLYTTGMDEQQRMVFYSVYECAHKLGELDD